MTVIMNAALDTTKPAYDALATPPLDATADPSPVFETIVSPSLEDADKQFDLDAPAPQAPQDTWRMPECWGHRGVSPTPPSH